MNRHSMVNSLKVLLDLVPVNTVIDVGVGASCTQELTYLFSDKSHILFEPDATAYAAIHQHYNDKKIKYTLRETALDRITTLDSEMSNLACAGPYLLKIDVDGQEFEVLDGAVGTLPFCSGIVIECTAGAGVTTMMKLLNFFNLHNFSLWDIVDLSYYKDQLWQVDIVLVNNKYRFNRQHEPDNLNYCFVDPEDWMSDPVVVSGEFLLKK